MTTTPIPAVLSVWTPVDTSEMGPSTDEVKAAAKIEREDDKIRLHVTSMEGPLWTLVLDLTDQAAADMSFDLQIALPERTAAEEDDQC